MKLALTLVAAGFVGVLALTFANSLPEWCAHPERGGNAVVQPLCR